MEQLPRVWMTLAALSGFIAVAAGAFGAHGVADPVAKGWLTTGAHYQMIHALAVFACVYLWRNGGAAAGIAAWLFLAGGALFAVTLYAMALGAPRILGAVTPIGGLMLLAGWLALAWTAFAGTRSTPV
jgi:uncharacterized membrane protein YgdD (TMEM256/DUF423 family)